jgi:thiosulfate dehydrogenase (quinone) large subunit
VTRSGSFRTAQQVALVALRFGIGWHLFYEGWGKLTAVQWTARGYLADATGPLAPWFRTLAEQPFWLQLIDRAVVWGLIVLGALLMVGLFTRTAALLASLQLMLIYLAAPPWPAHGFAPLTPMGSELYVNKIVIEILALAVCVVFDTGRISGLDLLVSRRRRDEAAPASVPSAEVQR